MTDARVAEALVGSLVDGRYRVHDQIARGGMATVYTAVDERLERTVALKIVHHPGEVGGEVDRFMDEARTVARLAHPNVVTAFDQGTHGGVPYLVMEYIRGRTLREILGSRRRLTPAEALAVAEQMLTGIAAAHRIGLVHRDLKPENVLVAEAPSGGTANLVDSVVKVTDFGLAQAVQAATGAAGGPAAEQSPLLATVAYVAPELVTDGRIDPRGDVYATGILLFEMLTGRVPFDQGSPAEIAWQHVDQDVPPPSAYVSGLPPELDDLVVRATRRDPGARPTDAGSLLAEVQEIRENLATSVVRPRTGDATVVMSAVPPTERPAWSRLPSAAPAAAAGARHRDPPPAGAGRASRDSPPDPAAVRRRRVLMATGAAVLVLLVGVGAWWLGVGRWTPAPDLVGMSQQEARDTAEERGLRVEIAAEAYDGQVPAGHVLSQDPRDRVTRGGTVEVTLSLGPAVFPVPDIIGASLEVARNQLEELDLVVVEGEAGFSDTVPAGRVVSVEPAVGEEVTPGTEVSVSVSQGRAPIDVPSLLGVPVDQARALLQQRGLVASVEEVEDTAPAGQVLAQDPPAGSGAEPGATVTLQVSKGPPTVQVPDVTGRPCPGAVQILEGAGFEVVVIGSEKHGRVRDQNPDAGTGLRPGSRVGIACQ